MNKWRMLLMSTLADYTWLRESCAWESDTEIFKTEKQREKDWEKKKNPEYPRMVGQLQKCNIGVKGILERGERERGTLKAIFEAIMRISFKLMSDTKP